MSALDPETRRTLRLLRLYAATATAALILTALAGFRQERRARFEEIDVERINVVERDGRTRLVISNKARAPDIVLEGKTYHRSGGNNAGMIFYNDEGTENGGLGFAGETRNGRYSASGEILFDQYNQDQTVGIMYSDDNGRRSAGLHVWDRPNAPLAELAELVEGIKRLPDGPEKERRMAAARADARRRGLGGARRVMVGKTEDKAAVVMLADGQGRARLRLAVDSAGAARIEFLDEGGKVTARLPQAH
jgi:hypothetical protein